MGNSERAELDNAIWRFDTAVFVQRRNAFTTLTLLALMAVALVGMSQGGMRERFGFGFWELLLTCALQLLVQVAAMLSAPNGRAVRLLAHANSLVASCALGWLSSLTPVTYAVGFFAATTPLYVSAVPMHARWFAILVHWLAFVGFALLRGDPERTLYTGILASCGASMHYLYWRLQVARLSLEAKMLREQRSDIAQKLHDGLGAELSALLVEAREDVAMAPRVEAAISELRRIVVGLKRQAHAIETFAVLMKARLIRLLPASANMNLAWSGHARLSGELCEALEYSALEAVQNALKHGAARSFDVRISTARGFVTLSVQDDGSGCIGPASRSGLAHLQARAEALGGWMRFESAPGAGATLYWSAPILSGERVSPSMSG